ncbi:hypothetical protein PIB30_045982 [Stylosanthes scabra]|uniref:Uncharacterized protein n=1 Tax=Stylosanthes scabra TaxID=79078 RepID=A0ABU6TIA1_9FABA|nr:hypothetical protein [Stylosanthes scabra]
MGMPICMWCEENFNKIARSWGKVIRFDDRTELPKSYSTIRILIDSFQWERIHEWISITVEGRSFEVFVKEFGSEVYNVQSHPDLVEDTMNSVSTEEAFSAPVVKEIPAEIEKSSDCMVGNGSIGVIMGDPQLDAIIDCKLNYVQPFNSCGDNGGMVIGKSRSGVMSSELYSGYGFTAEGWTGCLELDPMAQLSSQIALDTGATKGVNEVDVAAGNLSPEKSLVGESGRVSCEEDKRICQGGRVLEEVDSGRLQVFASREDEIRNGNGVGVVADLFVAATEVDGNEDVGLCEKGVAQCGVDEGSGESEFLSEETLYCINNYYVGDFCLIEGGKVRVEKQGVNEDGLIPIDIDGVDSGDENNLIEATAAKEVWNRGGLFFDSSEEEELRAKLVKQKVEGKKRADLRPKVQRQGKKPSCIQGRTLATRKLSADGVAWEFVESDDLAGGISLFGIWIFVCERTVAHNQWRHKERESNMEYCTVKALTWSTNMEYGEE